MSTTTGVTAFEGWELDTSDPADPRARDVDIATRAGLTRPRDVRVVIEKNWDELTAHGEIRVCGLHPQTSGGRPGHEYWLNEAQSVALISMMRTPEARALRIAMVKLFVAWRRGQVEPPTGLIPDDTPSQSCVMQARIGDDVRLRACLKSLCDAAARTSGRSVQSIHGELRKPWGVASIYRIALTAYQHTAYVLRQIIDDSLSIHRLAPYKKQSEFPWGSH